MDFDLTSYFPVLEKEVKAFGLNVEIREKEKTKESTIRSAFLKGNTKKISSGQSETSPGAFDRFRVYLLRRRLLNDGDQKDVWSPEFFKQITENLTAV